MLKREQKRGRPGQTVEVVRNVEDKKLERTGMCGELLLWRIWRYQRGNHNSYIEEEQKIIVIEWTLVLNKVYDFPTGNAQQKKEAQIV
jgi:hypothetical protein